MSVGALSFGSSGSSGSAPLLKLFHSRQIGIDSRGGKVPIDWRRPDDRPARRLERRRPGRADGLGVVTPASTAVPAHQLRRLPREPEPGRAIDGRDDLHESRRRREREPSLWRRPPPPTEPSLAIDSYAARTETSVGTAGKKDWSAGLITTWNGPVWHAQGGWVHIGDEFDPQMGFLLRRGIDRYNGRVTPSRW